MTDTRAIARLPRLDIEIAHRAAPDEGAEYLSIQLRAAPGFAAVAAWLDPFALPRLWLHLDPFTAWLAAALPPPPQGLPKPLAAPRLPENGTPRS